MKFRLYSDRLRDRAKAGSADVYEYDFIPTKCRVQIRRIVHRALGKSDRYPPGSSIRQINPAANTIRETVCHEKGIDNFGHHNDPLPDLLIEFEQSDVEGFLDLLEVSCVVLENVVTDIYGFATNWSPLIGAESAIDEINFRLRDANVGFQFESGSLVRVDSQYLHSEAVKPALTLLALSGFEGPQAEFLNAHEHYRQGRYKEAIVEAAKAFESTMKAVCEVQGWDFPSKGRASDLLKVLRKNELWPGYLDGSFEQLIATLGSGLPQVRNDDAAHGQGAAPRTVPSYIASYALHLAASKIVLIVEASSDRQKTGRAS